MPDQKAEYAPPSHPPSDGETRPLPEGWLKQFDPNSNAWFYVDTLASPPRSIWVHPYDDPQYLESHPHVRDYDSHDIPPEYYRTPSPPPVPTDTRPHKDKGKDKAPEKRGFLGKLKDKAIGTKEEREAAKRLRAEERQERISRLARQREHAARHGAPPQMYPGQYPNGGYEHHPGGSYQQGAVQPGYGQPVYVQSQPARRGFGGGGMALPLIGGLAGGLLLGDLIGGDGFGGGDFGGGDFGGGF